MSKRRHKGTSAVRTVAPGGITTTIMYNLSER
jgi:hypothetical protein